MGPILQSSLFPQGDSFVKIKISLVSCSSQWETASGWGLWPQLSVPRPHLVQTWESDVFFLNRYGCQILKLQVWAPIHGGWLNVYKTAMTFEVWKSLQLLQISPISEGLSLSLPRRHWKRTSNSIVCLLAFTVLRPVGAGWWSNRDI